MSPKSIEKVLLVALGVVCFSGAAQATQLVLPAANVMSVGLYNSFNVYSLDLLKQCAAAGDARCLPSGPYPVQSSPGQIADQAVVLTSSQGYGGNIPSPFAAGAAVDDAFMTPTGNQSATFAMNGSNEPGGTFTGDILGRWDISLSLLAGYLGVHDLVFLFDNNQEQNGTGGDVNIWAQARVVDLNGNIVNNLCFEVSTGVGGCADTSFDPNPLASSYLPVAQGFCVDKSSGLSYAPTGSGANACKDLINHPAGGYFVENNLGTSDAEFAAFNQALNDAAKNPLYGNYFLSINVKYTGNDAGAEQMWICSQCDIGERRIPEPAALALAGLGLVGLATLRRRRQA